MIRINNFQKGKSSSPYVGDGAYWNSQSLDIHGQPGIARINYKPVGVSTNVTGRVTSIKPLFGVGGDAVIAPGGNVHRILDRAVSTLTNASGDAYYVLPWLGYVLATGTTTLKATAINAGMDGAWTTVSSSLENTTNHKMTPSMADGICYFPNDNKVASLTQKAGQTFDPTNAATFTLTLAKLTIPTGYQIESVEDFGRYLAVFADITGADTTVIYLWDRSDSQLADAQFVIREKRMTRTLEHHGDIYITGGTRGNIYKLSESGLRKYAQIIPQDFDNYKDINTGGNMSTTTLTYESMAMWKDKLMVAVTVPLANNASVGGLYSVKDGAVNQEIVPSNGLVDGTMVLNSMSVVKGELLFAWSGPSSTYGIDFLRDDNKRAADECYIESLVYQAGTHIRPANFSQVEIQLSKPLRTGEVVKLYYRTDVTASWTSLGEHSFATAGAVSSLLFPRALNGIRNIQFRVELEIEDITAAAWSFITNYVVGDKVRAGYSGRETYYECIRNNDNKPPADNPLDWKELPEAKYSPHILEIRAI
jgi:hypothetical protein